MNLKAHVLNEGYNLKTISVSYCKELNTMMVVYPLLGELLMQVNVSECQRYHGEIAPQSLDTDEWKEFMLSDEGHVEFMHERLIQAIVRKDLIITNSLKMNEHIKTKQYLRQVMECEY
jgi:hypothetical protein